MEIIHRMDGSNSTNSHLLEQADPSSNANMHLQVHQEFTQWAITQGVIINQIASFRFPGKGLGLIANKDFEV